MPKDTLPPLRDVIEAHGLAAKKSLGQHFLLDLNVTRKIARLAALTPDDRVLEVGPGPGGLTRALLEIGADVTAIERDPRCLDALAEIAEAYPGQFRVVNDDALAVVERDVADAPVKIVSNLPYNISTELLIKWLRQNHEQAPPLWSGMTLMFQKEVADRILAPPGGRAYGRLSVIAQATSSPRRGYDLPARAFTPPPKVDSTVVVFEPAPAHVEQVRKLERVTQAAFSQRRKMLRSSMKQLWGERTIDRLESVGVLPTQRAEEIPVDKYIALANLRD